MGCTGHRASARVLAIACLLTGLITACDEKSAFEADVPDGTHVDIPSTFALNDGETFTVDAEITDASGAPIDADLAWSTSDADIATVSSSGVVTGRHPGTAIISARAGDVRDSASVTIRQVPVRLEYVSGSDQEGIEFEPLNAPAAVRLLDRHDDPVPGVIVDFIVSAGGGAAQPSTVTTNAQGNASTTWTLGASGAQQLRSIARPPQHVAEIPDSIVMFAATAEEAEPDPDPVPANPSAVSDLEVTGATQTGIALRWTAVADGDGGSAKYAVRYGSPTIQWSAAHATEITVPAGQTGAPVTYTYPGLTPGTGYQFQLVSYRGTLNAGAVFGPVSNVVSATTDDDDTPPPPPPLTSGSATATAGDGQVVLSATAPAGGTPPYSYQWHGATSDPGTTPGAGTQLAGQVSLSAVHSPATNGTTYYYRLVVTDQDGGTAVSNVTSATPAGTGSSAQTLLHEDWSGGLDTDVWQDGYHPENHSVVSDPTGSGRGPVLRAEHTDDGGAAHLAHWTHDGEVNPTGELFMRTWIFVPADFDGSNYAKMLFIKGNRMDDRYSGFGQAGNPSNGTNFFSGYVSYGAPGHSDAGVHFYTYHVDMGGVYGDVDYTRAASGAALTPAPGAWHKFEYWLRQNTVGQSDGAQRLWIDDELVLEWTGLRFRTSEILQANSIALTFSSSNNEGQVWYVDDVYVMDRQPTGMAGW